MSSLALELFREVRPGLFRVLAGPNARTYVDVLDALETEASQRHEGMSREEALAITVDILEQHPDFLPESEELTEAALLGGPHCALFPRRPGGKRRAVGLGGSAARLATGGQESLLRFASCVLTGSSKRLAELAAEDAVGRHTGKVGVMLERVTAGALKCLEDAGILQSPRFVLLHGPLRLQLDGGWLDLGVLRGPVRLSDTDVDRASQIETTSLRCLTVENETTFHELAKLGSGELLICTSYPGSAALALLRKLPARLVLWHFGDRFRGFLSKAQ